MIKILIKVLTTINLGVNIYTYQTTEHIKGVNDILKIYKIYEIEEILKQHQEWLGGNGGTRADLSDTDLNGADLRRADLNGANLSGANLRGANLNGANLRGANLRVADLNGANLRGANLRCADLSVANLRCADLSGADLNGANLSGADLRGADLNGANLSGANLSCAYLSVAKNISEIIYTHETAFLSMNCPEEGSFIGYKKARGAIVKLEITEDALRSSATTRKCRCNKAKVLDITKNGEALMEISSTFDHKFIYKVGEIVEVDNFDTDRWNECSDGIHFFITKQEAENWE